jgi:septal ring factor EnvC (AmiA/AmiB activator)
MLTIDEQLDQAQARVKALEGDVQAGANLLAEAATKSETLTVQVTELQARNERLDADLLTARQSIESLSKLKGESETRLGELVARNKDLESREQDIEARASKRAAEIVASTGSRAPAPVTPKGDHQTDDLVARFKAITNPKDQTIFWRSLTAQQQALILNSNTNSQK